MAATLIETVPDSGFRFVHIMSHPDPFSLDDAAERATPDDLTLAAFNTDCPADALDTLAESLDEYFDVRNVTDGTTDSSDEFAVLHDGVLFDGALLHVGDDVSDVGPATSARPTDTAFIAGYDDREGLRFLSQRIEKLAWRAGTGNLYVTGSQRVSTMDDQWDLYEGIARNGANVHVYDDPNWLPNGGEPFTVHGDSHSLAGTWLVVFDGAGNDAAKGALAVEEREPNSYYGLWTIEPEIVDRIGERAIEGRYPENEMDTGR